MAIPTVNKLFSFAHSLEGSELLTLGRKSGFTVAVRANKLEFTPASSKQVRSEPREYLAALLARLAKTGSFQPVRYQDITFNASYVLALVRQWQATQTAP